MGLGDDPFQLGRETLDNTPWWIHDNRRGTERSLGFCNPYGYEDSKVVVVGGTRNPNAEAYLWQCRNYAEARYRMTCANGHEGRMTLCYAHAWQIGRRQAGLCPRCAWPDRARSLDETITRIMREMANPRLWPDERERLAQRLRDCSAEMDELRARGAISNGAPLRLTEVS